jgi:pyruvate kinase
MRKIQLKPSAPSPFDLDLNHKYLFFRRTKIIATLGPSSSSPEKIRALIKRGVNVFRINFSHGDPQDHITVMQLIRKITAAEKTSVAILGDLCGPKIRVGQFANGSVTLKDGDMVTITTDAVMGTERLIPSRYKGLIREVSVGEQVLLDDGNLELKIIKKFSDSVQARVIRGGILKNNKGMNLPDTQMRISALTEKDKSDVLWCIKGGVDFIALSFVRQGKDITDLRRHLQKHKADIPIIAKIEKPEALNNIKEILEQADGIMIARGDLGVELPAKKVPIIQNKLIRITNQCNKPVIVATQMLESMMDHGRPTRAEVTDVAAACLAGADAVMLSGETAAGKYPLEAVEMMDSICREAEAYQFFALGGRFRQEPVDENRADMQNAIGLAAAQLSRDLMVRCVFVLTRSGRTARCIAADRPAAPVLALTKDENVFRRLHLLWGVYPYHVNRELTTQSSLAFGESLIKRLKLGKKGDHILMLSSVVPKRTTTNSIVVHQIT